MNTNVVFGGFGGFVIYLFHLVLKATTNSGSIVNKQWGSWRACVQAGLPLYHVINMNTRTWESPQLKFFEVWTQTGIKMSVVEFVTNEELDMFQTFDSMKIRRQLLRGVYAYGKNLNPLM